MTAPRPARDSSERVTRTTAVTRSSTHRLTLVGLLVEAAAVAVMIAVAIVGELTNSAGDLRQGLGVVLYLALVLATLLWLARGWSRAARWARVPILTVQLLIGFAVGLPFAQAGRWVIAAPVLLVCVVTGVGALREALTDTNTPSRGGSRDGTSTRPS